MLAPRSRRDNSHLTTLGPGAATPYVAVPFLHLIRECRTSCTKVIITHGRHATMGSNQGRQLRCALAENYRDFGPPR